MNKDSELMHYGTPRHSGRYPYGSGDDAYQRNKSFLSRVNELKKSGLTEKEISEFYGVSISSLRNYKSIATNEIRNSNMAKANLLRSQGYGDTEIGRRMGVNESTVRAWLADDTQKRAQIASSRSDERRVGNECST